MRKYTGYFNYFHIITVISHFLEHVLNFGHPTYGNYVKIIKISSIFTHIRVYFLVLTELKKTIKIKLFLSNSSLITV